ncbi:MAG TPA: zf-HC2 domain-containing protein [Candidatus Baltobacteraceae bacterium]|nr:zf-HC2 domain-containing protein [Candidatus Baltobacteraceae bacterium]
MNESRHVDELVASYAFGILDRAEAMQVEEHAASCSTCRQLLGQAEEAVTAMVDAGPLHIAKPVRTRRSWAPAAALAASLLLAAGLGARVLQLDGEHSQAAAQHDAAVVALVHSHFQHAPLVARAAGAPPGKVIFARDRYWVLVVLDAPPGDLTIATLGPAGTRVLGRPSAQGTTSEFFYRSAAPIDNVAVMRGAQLIESARI